MVSIAVFKLWTISKHPGFHGVKHADMSNINMYALYSDPLHFCFVDQGSDIFHSLIPKLLPISFGHINY